MQQFEAVEDPMLTDPPDIRCPCGTALQCSRQDDSIEVKAAIRSFFDDDNRIYFHCMRCSDSECTFAWCLPCGCSICEVCVLWEKKEEEAAKKTEEDASGDSVRDVSLRLAFDCLNFASVQEEDMLACDCDLKFKCPPLPDYAPRAVAREKLASRLDEGSVNWKAEFRTVWEAGWPQVFSMLSGLFKESFLQTCMGIVILFLWACLILYSNSWLTLNKFVTFLLLTVFFILSLATERVQAEGVANFKLGVVGSGFATRFVRWTGHMSKLCALVCIVCLIWLAVCLVWDVVLSFYKLSTWFYIVSAAALLAAEYFNFSYSHYIILFSFIGIPVGQLVFAFYASGNMYATIMFLPRMAYVIVNSLSQLALAPVELMMELVDEAL